MVVLLFLYLLAYASLGQDEYEAPKEGPEGMEQRESMPVWRFGVAVVFFLIASVGLYWGIGQWGTEPSVSWTLPLQGETIILDAGHGGVDPGAVSESGILEKEVTLAVAEQLRGMLIAAGADVVMIREDDVDLAETETRGYSRRKNEDLRERARLIRESEASLFISLHCNAIPSSKWSGAQTFYHDQQVDSKLLAEMVQKQFGERLGNSRTIKKRNDIYLLKRAEKVGVLVELGFLSNPAEAKQLTEHDHQEKLANAVYKGILAYYAEK